MENSPIGVPPPEAGRPARTARKRKRRAAPPVDHAMRLDLPVIAVLAERRMTLGQVLELGRDSIIAFDKGVADPVDVFVNNCRIGAGKVVQVGDRFGLHIESLSGDA